MPNNNTQQNYDIGMIGLGVMGRNLLLNIADHTFSGAGYDKDASKVNSLKQEAKDKNIYATETLTDFIQSLKTPRAIMLLVPAGKIVDDVIAELLPHLQKDDLIIDAGNSHFTDTDKRTVYLQEKGINFLGIGISGGEEGARHGPSIMPGGVEEVYNRIKPILEAASAKVNGEPCVTYLGNGSVGHYVKMVHNGIEYGIMQLIAETYDLMKRGLNLDNKTLSETYAEWNATELNSYLVEITANIFKKMDDKSNKPLIDEIVSVAKQNGTGMWTSQSSFELQMPVPTIDVAVEMRDLSTLISERKQISPLYNRPIPKACILQEVFIKQLKDALYAAMLLTYAQGMELLSVASQKYNYQLNLASLAKIWRGGCIIRAKILEDIYKAYQENAMLSNLLVDKNFSEIMNKQQECLRQTVSHASHLGIPAPGLMSALSYFDSMRSEWSPANLIQAQRDYFGSHSYERIDEEGVFHTAWE